MKILTSAILVTILAVHAVRAAQPKSGVAENRGEPTPAALSEKMKSDLQPYLNPDEVSKTVDASDQGIRDICKAIIAAVPEQLSVTPEKKRRVLYITNGDKTHLDMKGGLLVLLREAVRKSPMLNLDICYHDETFVTPDMLRQYDAVVVSVYGGKMSQERAAIYNQFIPEYVEAGGGFMTVHVNAALFRGTQKPLATFSRMLGGAYGGLPKQSWRGAGMVPGKVVEPAHPLMKAFGGRESMEFREELYIFDETSNADKAARVLLRIDRAKAPDLIFRGNYWRRFAPGEDWMQAEPPDFSDSLIWIKRYGKGRVFYCQPGHYLPFYAHPLFAPTLINGLLYATGDLKCDDSPSPSQPAAERSQP